MKSFFSMFSESFKSLRDIRTLTTTGILLALAFAIRSFSIEVTPDLRIGFTFLATCTIGMLYGPVVCGASTFVLDFIGYIVQNKSPRAYSPQLAVVVVISGVIYGCLLYKCDFSNKKIASMVKIAIARASVVLFCNIGLNSYFLYTLYVNKDFGVTNLTSDGISGFAAYCVPRVVKNLVQLPVDLVILMIFLPMIKYAYDKVRAQFGHTKGSVA
ncbi:folate family ECF transporter S component [Ruminococcus sp. Marseille-P6503]|uniref:folate family ECF transporter S component n=1 Tax=Ruminococcus sp. Marseille-P6503 TaxID=2364796 RepID=UPI000F520A92|nr:folate family ECF transporter S component [Ruminococcus sp. Marseille-P6503]